MVHFVAPSLSYTLVFQCLSNMGEADSSHCFEACCLVFASRCGVGSVNEVNLFSICICMGVMLPLRCGAIAFLDAEALASLKISRVGLFCSEVSLSNSGADCLVFRITKRRGY